MTEPKSVLDLDWTELIRMDGSLMVAVREELGLTPEEMAVKLHCHASTLNRYENERIKISVQVVQRVSELLDEARAARGLPLLQASRPAFADPQQSVVPSPPTGREVVVSLPPGYRGLMQMQPVHELPYEMPPVFVGIRDELPSPPRGQGGPVAAVPGGSTPLAGAPAPSKPTSALALSQSPRWSQRVERWGRVACLIMLSNLTGGFPPDQALLAARSQVELVQGQTPLLWSGVAKGSDPTVGKQLAPFKGQKQAPCAPESGEFEADKRCWWQLNPNVPCPPGVPVKYEGRCLVPVPETPHKPIANRSQ